MLKFVYFGTPKYSAQILEQLIAANFVPTAVICNPDRPVGKKKIITPPPTKVVAAKHGIQVFQPENRTELDSLAPKLASDFSIVAYYYQMLSKEILNRFRLGTIGVHYSFLPKYRGATPVQAALLNGDSAIGISLYLIDEKLDHGPILSQKSVPLKPIDTYLDLENKLTPLAGEMLIQLLPDFIAGKIQPQEQDHNAATFTKKFTTADAEVDIVKDKPLIIYRKIQAFTPEPGVWTMNFKGYEGKRVKLLEAEHRNNELIVKKIQVEGKKPQSLPTSY